MINKKQDEGKPALYVITNRLIELGYSEAEAEFLVARLLEEEASTYLESLSKLKDRLTN